MNAPIRALACFVAIVIMAPGETRADVIFDNDPAGSTAFPFTQTRILFGAATYFSDVAQDTVITGITVQNHINALRSSTAQMQFLIYDVTTSQFVYEGAPIDFQGEGVLGTDPTAKSSAPLSVTLRAGDSYDIGYITDTTFSTPFATSATLPSFTEGGLTAVVSNHSFGGPIGSPFSGTTLFDRMLPIQLSGFVAVPAPASLLLLGMGLLGVPARRILGR